MYADDYLELWTSTAPFSSFEGYLKCIRLDQVNHTSRSIFADLFGGFFTTEIENVEGKRQIETVLERSTFERGPDAQPYRYRRFAGGSSLPRGSYFSIANSDAGNDGGTLAAELAAYREGNATVVWIGDSAQPGPAIQAALQVGLKPFDVPPRTLLLFSRRPTEEPEWWSTQRLTQDASIGCSLASYTLEHHDIDKVIDLRLPATQSWLYDLVVGSGLPGVAYYYSPNIVSEQLVVFGERPTSQPQLSISGYHGGSHQLAWLPPNPHWDRSVRDGPENFLGLLPFLVFPGRGGSPITEAVGRHLRRSGAKALIYPSSRADVLPAAPNGDLPTFGWNLVDYRIADSDDQDAWVIVSPDSWWGLRSNGDVRVDRDGRWSIVSI